MLYFSYTVYSFFLIISLIFYSSKKNISAIVFSSAAAIFCITFLDGFCLFPFSKWHRYPEDIPAFLASSFIVIRFSIRYFLILFWYKIIYLLFFLTRILSYYNLTSQYFLCYFIKKITFFHLLLDNFHFFLYNNKKYCRKR